MKSILLWASPASRWPSKHRRAIFTSTKEQVDLANRWRSSTTPRPEPGCRGSLTDIAVEAFSSQSNLPARQWLFPSDGNRTGHQTEFKKAWGTGPALKSLPFRPLSKNGNWIKMSYNAASDSKLSVPRASARSRTEQSQALARTLCHRRRQLGPMSIGAARPGLLGLRQLLHQAIKKRLSS